jgi:hypothetical protein
LGLQKFWNPYYQINFVKYFNFEALKKCKINIKKCTSVEHVGEEAKMFIFFIMPCISFTSPRQKAKTQQKKGDLVHASFHIVRSRSMAINRDDIVTFISPDIT